MAVLLAICAIITIKYVNSKQTAAAFNKSDKSKEAKAGTSPKDSFAAHEEVFDE